MMEKPAKKWILSHYIQSLVSKSESITVIILIVMLIITASMQGNFFSEFGFKSNINSFVPLVLLTMGQAVVIISGGLDLSCGSAMSLLLCIMTQIMKPDVAVSGLVAIIVAFVTTIAIGFIN
ncbi:MAG: hypothetical protein LBQ60_11955, partial [Bacteroidales bacterium]|nr:hypothetical protein [Bacteroidales bacterium]